MSEIRIIQSPSIYMIGRQSVDEAELARFLADNGSPGWATDAPSAGEKLVEVAGRTCYDSFKKPRPGGNAAYISHILEVGHGSVAEHCLFTVLIAGVSRSLTHELIRHRVGLSPSQLSQRFVDESDCAFVVPPALIGAEDDKYLYWLEYVTRSSKVYKVLAMSIQDDISGTVTDHPSTSARKAAREAARSVLPNCVETKICLTGNARAWRGMLDQRGTQEADAEFCRLAVALLRILQQEAPHIFRDYTVETTAKGREYLRGKYRKV